MAYLLLIYGATPAFSIQTHDTASSLSNFTFSDVSSVDDSDLISNISKDRHVSKKGLPESKPMTIWMVNSENPNYSSFSSAVLQTLSEMILSSVNNLSDRQANRELFDCYQVLHTILRSMYVTDSYHEHIQPLIYDIRDGKQCSDLANDSFPLCIDCSSDSESCQDEYDHIRNNLLKDWMKEHYFDSTSTDKQSSEIKQKNNSGNVEIETLCEVCKAMERSMTLKHQCRLKIRRILGSNLPAFVQHLGLPLALQKYVALIGNN